MSSGAASKPDRPSGMNAEPIALVGMSCLFPKAEGLREYWANLKSGVDAIEEIPAEHWNPSDYFDADPTRPDHTHSQRGGFLPTVAFDPLQFGVTPTSMEATDTSQLLSLIVAQGALTDAGYGPDREFDRSKISVILGVTGALELTVSMGARLGHPVWRKALNEAGVDPAITEEVVRGIGDSYVAWQEDTFPGLLGNVVAGRIANRLDLGGTNCVVDAACASSLSAAHLAMLELQSGRADMAITGGVDTFNDIFMYMCFGKTQALSPSGDARPFDANADGTVLGEGIGMVVMKRLSDAERDGDTIYAVVKSIGSSSDGRGKAIYAPDASGQERALRDAYARAQVDPATIGLLESHGTGTKVGDATEVDALKEVFPSTEEQGSYCAIGSVKSQIGHTKAAAGVAGLIKAALALRYKVLPPTIKVREPNAAVDHGKGPFYINTRKRPWLARKEAPRRAGVSAFGFGGTNFHAVLEEHEPHKTEIDWDGKVQIVALSGESRDAIGEQLRNFSDPDLSWKALSLLAHRSRQDFSPDHPYRLLQVIQQDKTNSATLFGELEQTFRRMKDRRRWSTPEGAFFGSERKFGKLGFLFPGQGSQYVGMCLDLSCLFPKMQEILTKADLNYGDVKGLAVQLSDFIYPHPAFGIDAEKINELTLRATEVAQPAIGAVSVGALCVLAMFGVLPDAAGGHSFGELVALLAGGKIDVPTMLHLSKLRGELMAAAAEDEAGAMLAVRASSEEAEAIILEGGLDVVVANRNGPSQVVLSGTGDAVSEAQKYFKQQKIAATALPVAAAFHSALVADAAEPFRAAMDEIEIGEGDIPIFANSTGEAYPADETVAKDLLGSQLANPVEFVSMIEGMYESGVRTFVEVGPGSKLTGLTKSILEGREFEAIALDASSGRENGVADLAKTLAHVASLGHEVDLGLWDADAGEAQSLEASAKPGMKIMISGANYRMEKKGSGQNAAVAQSGAKHKRPDQQSSVISAVSAARPATAPTAGIPTPPPQVGAPHSVDRAVPVPPPPNPSAQSAPHSAPEFGTNPPLSNPALLTALQATQHSLHALQKLQAQTAELHSKFLEGQEAAQQNLIQLLARQEQLFGFTPSVTPVAVPPIPSSPPPQAASVPQAAAIAPVAAPAPLTAPTSATPNRSGADIGRLLLEVVSEKTGYPSDMLNLEMDMESDLGIDSIKRVEILSAMQEAMPEAPAVEPDQLAELRTLAQVTELLSGLLGEVAPAASNGAKTTSDAGMDREQLSALLLEVVSDKTGYPTDMLSLEMEMESDLGIDSIKRVEILSELQERYPAAPTVEPDEIGEMVSLADIVDFLAAAGGATTAPSLAASPTAVASNGSAPAPPATGGLDRAHIETLLLNIVSDKTGYPSDMLSLEMDLESDLGIDSIKRVEILSTFQDEEPEAPVAEPDDLGKLRTLGEIVDFLVSSAEAFPPANANGKAGVAISSGANGAATADFANGTVKPSGNRSALELEEEDIEELKRTVLEAVKLEPKASSPALALAEGGTILIASEDEKLAATLAEQLGAQGHRSRTIRAEDVGSVAEEENLAGLIFLASRNENAAEAESIASGRESLRNAFRLAQAAGPKLREAADQSGAVLVTISRIDAAFGLGASASGGDPAQGGLAGLAKTAAKEWPGVECKAIDVACGWNDESAIAQALAEEILAQGPTEVGLNNGKRMALQEIREEPTESNGTAPKRPLEESDLVVISGGARGVTAEAALALAAACRPTFLLLGRTPEPEPEPEWLRPLGDQAEIKRALLEQSNGSKPTPRELEASYRKHLANREVSQNIERIEAAGSRVIYRSVDICDESAVDAAIDAARRKFGPVRAVIHGAGVLADRFIEDKSLDQFDMVFDTKVRGYHALMKAVGEDELQCLVLFSSVSARYGNQGQVDYAMANEVLNKFAQRESIRRPDCRVVSINWGPWDGGMVTPSLRKVFEAEGISLIPLDAGAQFMVEEMRRPASSPVEIIVGGRFSSEAPEKIERASTKSNGSAPEFQTAFDSEISVERHPILASHVIGARAALPAALIVEWLAHGALHQNPGLLFHGFNNLEVLKGVKVGVADPYPIRVVTGKAQKKGDHWHVQAQMRGGENFEIPHARAEIVLAASLPASKGSLPDSNGSQPYPRSVKDAYREILFHGEDLHGIRSIESCNGKGIFAEVDGAPEPSRWIREPFRSYWLADPMALDCALQLQILWNFENHGEVSLPTAIGEYRQYASRIAQGPLQVRLHASPSNGSQFSRADIDFFDSDGTLVARMTGTESVMDPSLMDSFQQRTLAASEIT